MPRHEVESTILPPKPAEGEEVEVTIPLPPKIGKRERITDRPKPVCLWHVDPSDCQYFDYMCRNRPKSKSALVNRLLERILRR
jgi:hypothetical protein